MSVSTHRTTFSSMIQLQFILSKSPVKMLFLITWHENRSLCTVTVTITIKYMKLKLQNIATGKLESNLFHLCKSMSWPSSLQIEVGKTRAVLRVLK